MDLNDLRDILVCEKCRVLYMPEFEEDRYSDRSKYAINDRWCSACTSKHKSTTGEQDG